MILSRKKKTVCQNRKKYLNITHLKRFHRLIVRVKVFLLHRQYIFFIIMYIELLLLFFLLLTDIKKISFLLYRHFYFTIFTYAVPFSFNFLCFYFYIFIALFVSVCIVVDFLFSTLTF